MMKPRISDSLLLQKISYLSDVRHRLSKLGASPQTISDLERNIVSLQRVQQAMIVLRNRNSMDYMQGLSSPSTANGDMYSSPQRPLKESHNSHISPLVGPSTSPQVEASIILVNPDPTDHRSTFRKPQVDAAGSALAAAKSYGCQVAFSRMDDMSIGLGKIEYDRSRTIRAEIPEPPLPPAQDDAGQGATLGLGKMSYDSSVDVNPSQLSGTLSHRSSSPSSSPPDLASTDRRTEGPDNRGGKI
eukprot:747583-Hanusia_phi.AAC.2